jgi:hypothetical protein
MRWQVLPFKIRYGGSQSVTNQQPEAVMIRPGGSAFVTFGKYRCDIADRALVQEVKVILPNAAGTYRRRTHHSGSPGPTAVPATLEANLRCRLLNRQRRRREVTSESAIGPTTLPRTRPYRTPWEEIHERYAERFGVDPLRAGASSRLSVPVNDDAASPDLRRRDRRMSQADPALGRPLTLARRLAAGRSPQPICSASSTMIPSGPRT